MDTTAEPTQEQIDQVLAHLRLKRECDLTILSYHDNRPVHCTLPASHDGNHMGTETNGAIRWWDR